MLLQGLVVLLSLAAGANIASATVLVSSPGEIAAIPSWDLKPSVDIKVSLEGLSRPGLDTSSWHHIKNSKCTLMGCLIDAGFYNETELFYSDNLRRVDEKQFRAPWVYRNEFSLEPRPGQHFFLQTHGISSRADIFLNGKQVVSSAGQAGSYVGRTYDVTKLVNKANALAIQVYPTDYYRDLALGWVDWNPWPADNGTGVWRDVEIKQTGAVMLEPLRVVTHLGTPLEKEPASVTLKAKARNLKDTAITVTAKGLVAPISGGSGVTWSKPLTLPPLSVTDIVLEAVVDKPKIWWPRQWGDQPLYTATLTVTTSDGDVSDYAASEFGFRTVTSQLNAYNDTTFVINSHPFQVIAAGYAPNMFLRWDASKWESELHYILDLGFNTVRLEGKNEHPALYSIADRLGVMVMAGWECCDKWEAWSYNQDLAVPTPLWTDADYAIANASMRHEAALLQPHPSVLVFLIGSDYWPDERATALYLSAFRAVDWRNPVIGSASKRGFSPQTGPSGMKMDGPYDWVPPNYWFDTEQTLSQSSQTSRLGAAAGFASELSPGVGTPALSSLRKFLSAADLADLWRAPDKRLFHMSRETSQFQTRTIYNAALWHRWGKPRSLEDYLVKAQMMDYEAVRAQVGAYGAMWGDGYGRRTTEEGKEGEVKRPATGMVYWMGNNAWPGLHWNLWDYYLRPAGAYFGAKAATGGGLGESVVFDYVRRAVWVVNRSLHRRGERKVEVQILRRGGAVEYVRTFATVTTPNTSRMVAPLGKTLGNMTDVVFLRLVLTDKHGEVLNRNVYWVANELDVLDWDKSEWYFTPVSGYADYTALNSLPPAKVTVAAVKEGKHFVEVTLENLSDVPAVFVGLNLVDRHGEDVLPLRWEDNFVTLWPKERLKLGATAVGRGTWEPDAVQVEGKNVERRTVKLGPRGRKGRTVGEEIMKDTGEYLTCACMACAHPPMG